MKNVVKTHNDDSNKTYFSNLEYDCIGNLYCELLYDDNIVLCFTPL